MRTEQAIREFLASRTAQNLSKEAIAWLTRYAPISFIDKYVIVCYHTKTNFVYNQLKTEKRFYVINNGKEVNQ